MYNMYVLSPGVQVVSATKVSRSESPIFSFLLLCSWRTEYSQPKYAYNRNNEEMKLLQQA